MYIKSCRTLRVFIGTSVVAMAVSPVRAQDQASESSPAADSLQEVVVTATKQGQTTVLSTPISVQAITGAQLESQGATSFDDFFRQIPGLSAWDQGPGNKRIIIRGINSTGAGTVGLYLDEAVITGENSKDFGGLQPDPKLFDMERLEVLKGPQGTTFGAGAMSGVIRYITNKPDLDNFEGTIRVGITQQNYAGLGSNVDSAVNLPVVPNEFAVRLAGYYEGTPGWIDDRYQEGVNNLLARAGRLEGRLKTGERGTLDIMAMIQNVDTNGLSFYNNMTIVGQPLNRVYYQAWPERTPFPDHMQIFNITYAYELDSGTITATASHTHRYTDIVVPASQVIDAAFGLPLGDAEDNGVRSVLTNEKWRNTDNYELRYSSHFDGPLQTLVGLYHSYERRFEYQNLPTINDLGYPDPSTGIIAGSDILDNTLITHITETALFGEVYWAITPQLKLTLGGRIFEFDNNSQADVISSFGVPGSGYAPEIFAKERSGIGRFNLQYNFDSHTSTYLQIAQGYRPGGTNNTGAGILGHVTIPAGYNSDRLISYEAGFKQSSFDDRLRITAAGYFIDWTDLQVQLQTPLYHGTTFPYTGNAGGAHVKGVELELEAVPIRNLHLALTGGFTDAFITQTVVNAGSTGDPIPYTPKETFSASGDYRFPLFTGFTGFVGADAAWSASRVTSFPSETTSYFHLNSYALANARAGVDFSNWTVSLIVKNALNNHTVLDVLSEGTGLLGYLGDPPRLVMLQFATKFR